MVWGFNAHKACRALRGVGWLLLGNLVKTDIVPVMIMVLRLELEPHAYLCYFSLEY